MSSSPSPTSSPPGPLVQKRDDFAQLFTGTDDAQLLFNVVPVRTTAAPGTISKPPTPTTTPPTPTPTTPPPADDKSFYIEDATGNEWTETEGHDLKVASESRNATLYLRTGRNLTLGDSHLLTCLHGNSSSCKFVLDPPTPTLAPGVTPAPGATPAPPRALFSMTGAAHELQLRAHVVSQENIGANNYKQKVALPWINQISLAYGSISYIDKNNINSLSFLKKHPSPISIFNNSDFSEEKLKLDPTSSGSTGQYASLSLVSSSQLEYGQSTVFNLTSDHRDAGAEFKLGFATIKFPEMASMTDLMGKSLFNGTQSAGKGVNIYDYSRGFGRLSYEDVGGGIAQLLVRSMTECIVNVIMIQRSIIVCAPVFDESFIAAVTTHSYSRLGNISQSLFLSSLNCDWSIGKLTGDFVVLKIKLTPSNIVKMTRHYGGYWEFDYPGLNLEAGLLSDVEIENININDGVVNIGNKPIKIGKTATAVETSVAGVTASGNVVDANSLGVGSASSVSS